MAITVATVNATLESAATSIGAEDYAGAEVLLRKALVQASAIPNAQKGNAQLSMNTSAIREAIKACAAARGASLGVQRQRVTPRRPTDGDE